MRLQGMQCLALRGRSSTQVRVPRTVAAGVTPGSFVTPADRFTRPTWIFP